MPPLFASSAKSATGRNRIAAIVLMCTCIVLASFSLNQMFGGDSFSQLVVLHEKTTTDTPLWWFAPFFDRSSFGIEAATLVLGLIRCAWPSMTHKRMAPWPTHG